VERGIAAFSAPRAAPVGLDDGHGKFFAAVRQAGYRPCMRVLGVDPGSRVCGYGVIAVDPGRRLRYIECGVLLAPDRDPPEKRLAEIARCLAEVIRDLEPTALAVEDVFSHINPRSALALAQARGTVLAVAGTAGLQVHSYAPALIKKSVTGHGRASKDQVARMVQVLVGLRQAPALDATDALAAAITHAQRAVLATALTRERAGS
jgi:crossover junction endodeoxyribonuclease RuvC